MNSRQFEDDNGVMRTATLEIGVGKANYPNRYNPTKPHLLVFTSDVKGFTRKSVATEKSSINDFSIEELKTLLKKAQSKP